MQGPTVICCTLIPILQDNNIFFFSDEATFYLNEFVNKHNIQYWCETKTHITVEIAMNCPKVNVWCAFSKNQLIQLFFFENDNINGENYLAAL